MAEVVRKVCGIQSSNQKKAEKKVGSLKKINLVMLVFLAGLSIVETFRADRFREGFVRAICSFGSLISLAGVQIWEFWMWLAALPEGLEIQILADILHWAILIGFPAAIIIILVLTGKKYKPMHRLVKRIREADRKEESLAAIIMGYLIVVLCSELIPR